MVKVTSVAAMSILLGAILIGCAGGPSTTASSSSSPVAETSAPGVSFTPAAAGATITIAGMDFGAPITVAPGATVTIVNDDGVEHSVTSEEKGAFDTDVDGGTTETFAAPSRSGTYPFTCTYHAMMKGALIVVA